MGRRRPFVLSRDERARPTDAGREFAYLARYDLTSGERSDILKLDWDVEAASLSKSGRYLTVNINEDGRTDLRVFETATMKPVDLPAMTDANRTDVLFSRDDRRVAFLVSDSRTPSDLFIADLDGQPRRLTSSLNPHIDRTHLVNAQVIRFASPDGVQIPGILYKPHGAAPDAKAPARDGTWRPWRTGPSRLQRDRAVPGQSRVCRLRHQQSRKLRVREDLR